MHLLHLKGVDVYTPSYQGLGYPVYYGPVVKNLERRVEDKEIGRPRLLVRRKEKT